MDTDTIPAPPPPMPSSAVVREPSRKRRAAPVTMWFAGIAAVVFGGVLAVAVAQRLDVSGQPSTQAVAVEGVPRLRSEPPPVVEQTPEPAPREAAAVPPQAVSDAELTRRPRERRPAPASARRRAPAVTLHPAVREPREPLRSDPSAGELEIAAIGELQARDVRAVIARHQPRFRQCYDAALRQSGAPVEVRVVLQLAVDTRGDVASSTIDGPGFGSLHACLRGVARQFRFPPSLSGGVVPVPLAFSARSR